VPVDAKWPKVVPALSAEEKRIHADFMRRWHEILPTRYGLIERFNHGFPVRASRPGFQTTLEVGAGLGEHLAHEQLSAEQKQNYYALEVLEIMAERIRERHPGAHAIVADCQQRLDFPDGFFDRYIAVHVFEHLPNLPAAVAEAWRLLDKSSGQLLVVIPCEGGLAYSLARRVSAKRVFEKAYGIPYEPFIRREHLNVPAEILGVLAPYFTIEHRRFFPLPLAPLVSANLVIGLSLKPRPQPAAASAP
jgi:SAM-dependent methyltransferase